MNAPNQHDPYNESNSYPPFIQQTRFNGQRTVKPDTAREIVEFITSAYPVKTAFVFGEGSGPFLETLRDQDIEVEWYGDGAGTEFALPDEVWCDLSICIGYCDWLSVAKSDELIDFLCRHSALLLFQSGVPSKGRPAEATDQVQDYWISMFEMRGCPAVKGFGSGEHMPFLFCSKSSFDGNSKLTALANSANFNWRKRFEGTSIEHRATAHVKQIGPSTSGQTRNVAAVVVTFNPERSQLQHIQRLANLFECLIVTDNSEPAINAIPGIEWVPMSGNQGIAAALNAACERAKSLGYQWLLTLDQDADVEETSLVAYLQAFTAYDDKDGTAIVAPRSHSKDLHDSESKILDLDMVITSGSLTNLAIWEKIGGFTDELFIDEVDHDYCLRARNHGYRVVKLLNAQITHQAGRLMTVLTLRGRPALASTHPPIRLYYMSRNYFFIKKRYSETHPHIVAFQRRHLIGKFKEYLLYHRNRWPAVFSMIRGAIHGMMGRFGK